MFLRPFFSYFGSKFDVCCRSRRKLYPKPEFDIVVEPFAGAAGYAVNCFRKKVILYDLDPVVYGVWHYLIHAKASEIRALPDKVPETTAELNIPQEAKWLIGFWISRGQPRPSRKPSTWMKRRQSQQNFYWGAAVRGHIASQVQHIRHWKVYNKSYHGCPNRYATYFVDPPYQGKPGRSYKCNQVDFAHLAKWCQSRLGQVIVCENIGADWLPFRPLKSIKAAVRKGRKLNISKEAIWVKTDRFSGFKNLWEENNG